MSEKIDIEQVRAIAALSRIELPAEKLQAVGEQMGAILTYFGKLQQLDTEGVEPMAHAVDLLNVLAEDRPGQSLTPAQALANAPRRDGDFFMVPKVIGDSQ